MEKLIHFDVAALILLLVLLFSTIMRRMTGGTANRIFLTMVVSAIAAAAFDIWAVLLDNAHATHLLSLNIAHGGYLLTHSLMAPTCVAYIISKTDTWHKLTKLPVMCIFHVSGYLAVLVAVIANPFTGWLFNFDSGVYTRGEGFGLLYFCAAFYMVTGTIYLIAYRKLFDIAKLLALFSLFPLMILALTVQCFYPNSLVEMFANALGLLLITMTLQRPEEIIDSFTGLRKYNAYADDIKKAFANDKHVSIILLNIANFTALQSMLSYDAARQLLDHVTEVLINENKDAKSHAELYYLDMGRFRAVVNCYNADKAEALAERINDAMKKKVDLNGYFIELIPYVCIAKCPEEIQDFKSLMSFGADFHDKLPYSGEVLRTSEIYEQKRFTLLNELDTIIENALRNRKFKVYYQPIYSVEEQRFVTAEALLRLIDDEHGFIPPDLFIPVAEKNGGIHKIGEYVLEEVCRFIASDKFKELDLSYIEVNLSVTQCMQVDLPDKVMEILNRYGVSPDQINLEITESQSSYEQNLMQKNLDRLNSAGISFSLDDYGTGYSNVKRVMSLPLKIVKLDKTFVDEHDNPKMRLVLQNTVKMLKDMDMEIVVEGIETERMVQQFSELKCDFIQGYYYSKPIPEDQFVEFILNAKKHSPKGTVNA